MRKVIIILYCLILIQCKTETTSSPLPQAPPNIILIMTDDQGYGDLSSFGATDIHTPNIDRLAKEGSKYTRFYVPQSQCTPSRAGILTGCYPNRVGIDWVFLPHSETGLHTDEATIADILKPIGYSTAYLGKWHLGHHQKFLPTNQGFDYYYGIPYSNDMWPNNPRKDYTFPPLPLIENEVTIDTVDAVIQKNMTKVLTEKATEFITLHKEDPFFLMLSHPMPHVPLYVSDKFKGKSKRGLYGDVMLELDWSTGAILETLEKFNLEDNTMIMYMSDNGPWLAYGNHSGSTGGLYEGKETSYEGGIRSPLLIKYPNLVPTGKTINTPINGIDILPTIAAITEAPLPNKKIDGKNIIPQLTEESNTMAHDAYFFYMNKNQLESVMTKKWKLILPHSYNSLDGRPGGNDGALAPYKKVTVRTQLFNIEKDKYEKHNVAKANPDIVLNLSTKADSIRNILGDKIIGIQGSQVRPLGKI